MLASNTLKGAPDTTFWEQVAATRWGSYVTQIEKRTLLHAHSLAGKPGQALEMGCEGGRWASLLSKLGWQMTCVDIDPDALSVCRQRVPAAKCILANPDDAAIPCASDSMDLLLCIEVAPVTDSSWFLPEAARVLRAGGLLSVVVWNRDSLRAWVHARRNRSRREDGEFYNTPYSSWRRGLGDAGFQLEREEGFCWGPFHRASNSPLIPLSSRFERLLGLHRLTAFSPWIAVVARKSPLPVR